MSFKAYITLNQTILNTYSQLKPSMQRKILIMFIVTLFSIVTTGVYIFNILLNSSQTIDNPYTMFLIMLILIINMYLLIKGKSCCVIPTNALIILNANFTFFRNLPVENEVIITSMLAFATMIWVFISYKWWHLILHLLNVCIAFWIRFGKVHTMLLQSEISLNTYVSITNSYFLLLAMVALSFYAFYFLDREHKYFENAYLEAISKNELLTTLMYTMENGTSNMIESTAHSLEAYFDPMTKCFNMLAFSKFFHKNIHETLLGNHDCTVVFMDIDNLKYVNDTYGHKMGDWYIQTFVDTLRKSTRNCDPIYRIGGDEFVLLVKDISTAAIDRILIAATELFAQDCNQQGIAGSFSYGHAHSGEISNSTMLVEIADQRMYSMKREKKSKCQ